MEFTDVVPPAPQSVEELEDVLSQPWPEVIDMFSRLDGDVVFLGVGGKMGPTMARMAKRASEAAGRRRRIIGVSRFRDAALRQRLESWGIETIVCDLLDAAAVDRLPTAANVISMSGFKFGTSQNPSLAWATNCYLPALVCRRYRESRIVTFSTGNVYGTVSRNSEGSKETDRLCPDGEYAMAALGRERIYQYFSETWKIPTVLLRLNYATELRYGVLVDLATQVYQRCPIDISMGYVNVIWLADANAMSLLAIEQTAVPARIINVAGPDILETRELVRHFGELLQRPVTIEGTEQEDALLSNSQLGYQYWGRPRVSVQQMITWTADWVAHDRPMYGKPTHFESRTGKF